MKRRAIPYPCIGYCIIDARGYCTACGRPPDLGAPENCAIGKVGKDEALPESLEQPESRSGKAGK